MAARRAWRLVAVSVLLLPVACGRGPEEVIAQVRAGMTSEQVHQLLGEPHHVETSRVADFVSTREVWYGSDTVVTVHYLDGEVKLSTIAPQSGPRQ